jgi:glycosyltransferase involved in cell wall biosynthesis
MGASIVTMVSVVIPSIGRASLRRAVESALNQTSPPMEVIVVLDRDCEPDLPESHSIQVVRTPGGVGPSRAKQIGIESAKGNVIALLDDDDLWYPDKLEKQLAAAPAGDQWIMSCRSVFRADWRKPMIYPRKLIRPDERVPHYLFTFRSLRRGRPTLPVPTLVFPRDVAHRVPLSVSAGSIHDDPKWLMEVQRALPDLQIVQVPEALVEVHVARGSLSRPGVDRSEEDIDWGVRELADESPRVRGDYVLVVGVSSSLDVGSLRAVARSMVAGVRWGRPGPWAWAYGWAAVLRIVLGQLRIQTTKVAGGVRR